MERADLGILAVFLAIAEERSFTKAGRRMGVSPSAMSHAIRGLEEKLGVRLLSRTTRSVAPTEAGEQLLARLRPALTDVQAALDQLSGLRDKPLGRVRLLTSRLGAITVLAPKLAKFTRDYPDIILDITADDRRIDIVAGGFDAGISFGEFVAKDMIAVRISGDHRAAIVGSISKQGPGRSTRAIFLVMFASTIATDLVVRYTAGNSTRARNPCRSRSTVPWSLMTFKS
jgi:DNA-binding transcriptional LysR family regulator